MAEGSNAAAAPDENPYFAPDNTNPNVSNSDGRRRASDPAVSPRPVEPTTPGRELPPNLSASRSRPHIFSTSHGRQSTVALRRPPRAQPSRATLNPTVDDTQYDSSNSDGRQQQPQPRRAPHSESAATDGGRRRSSSEPQRPTWLAVPSQDGAGQSAQPNLSPVPEAEAQEPVKAPRRMTSWLSRIPTRSRADNQSQHSSNHEDTSRDDEVDSRIVDLLDVVDPEVSTLTSTTNIQNSLFIPYLGQFVNRRPTYDVSWGPARERETAPQTQKVTVPPRDHTTTHPAPPPTGQQEPLGDVEEEPSPQESDESRQRPGATRLTSHVQDSHYAVLPHGTSLDGWSQEDIDRLNDHVRHMLHSRRSKFKRSMQGFGRYVRRPLGFFVTLYATLITLFGLAWVLFLIGWIYVGEEKTRYLTNIIDYILVALFAIMGDGLAPFRMVDTYHMIYIAHYHNLSWKLRKKLLLPDLPDHNDLPTQTGVISSDIESARPPTPQSAIESGQFSVLSEKQQKKLQHHQKKYARSHTFYRPHETDTHYAFPLWYLVAITSLLDLHSCLQISLGSVTWGIKPRNRPFSLTTVILCVSITVNATAGLLIWIGDKKTRKKDVAERMARQELTEEAMRKVQKDKEEEEAREKEKEREERELAEGGGRKSLTMPRISLDKSLDKLTSAVKGEGSSTSGLVKKKDAVKEEDESEEKAYEASSA